MEVQKAAAIDLYRMMYKIRAFEEQCIILSRKGLIGGSLHLYIGEEAVAAGACYDLRREDYIASTHRGHGHCIAKGTDLGKMFAELLGRETGYCRGRGGSMHIADVGLGMLGANGIVGADIPIATGAGLACKYKGSDRVVVCFFGDGATNTGAFHEGVNLSAAWKLPIVFVCENNLYAVTTPIEKACALSSLAERASGYGMPGVCIDGNDVLAVREAAVDAVARARKGEGPTLVECQTYRWLGHHMGDDGKYRPSEEVEYWKSKRDPIANFGERLVREGILKEEELSEIQKEVNAEIDSAVRFATDSQAADVNRILEDVYYNPVI